MEGAGVELQKRVVFRRSGNKGVIIHGKAAVIGMADDVDQRIFNGPYVSHGVFRRSSAFEAGFVEAGDGVIQLLQKSFSQIYPSGIIQDVEFSAHEYVYAEECTRYDFKIYKIKFMACPRHFLVRGP